MKAHERYLKNAAHVLADIWQDQAEALETAAEHIAACFRSGGMLYSFGTGHSHMMAEELFYRAGGPARVVAMLDDRLMLHVSATTSTNLEREEGLADEILSRYPIGEKDVVIVTSNSGRNAVPVEVAAGARARGAYVIGLCCVEQARTATPRNKLNITLVNAVDLALSNGCMPGDASIDMPDGRRMGPTSTVACAAILNAVACRACEMMIERGENVESYVSSNVDGGDRLNQKLLDRYKGVIPCL